MFLHAGVVVQAGVTNLMDDRTQTDLWGVPLPGREALLNISVDTAMIGASG